MAKTLNRLAVETLVKGNMDTRQQYRGYNAAGWALTLVGCALLTYGYFKGGISAPLLNWPSFSQRWVADYLPKWQCETGMLLSIVGSIPVYYVR